MKPAIQEAISQPPRRRLVSKAAGAAYLGDVSADTIDRLINTGVLSVVKLPVTRSLRGDGTCRRVLLDLVELDALIERWKEKRT